MSPFALSAAQDTAAALQACAGKPNTRFIAGGTNLLDLMKEGVMRPDELVDINGLPLDFIRASDSGGLLLGALARNADTARHALVRSGYPLLASAILAGASPQLRNMASNGGNLLQRTRCMYFYDRATPCNKREPGSGCPAIGGLARQHAVLGASEHCIATHPSDMCVALAALDAVVHVQGAHGSRAIPFRDFHRLPGAHPERDTVLGDGELVTHIELPEASAFAAHSVYLKLRDRLSYAFALVSVAAALDLEEDGTVREARLALGGVAHKPWRVPQAEQALRGSVADAQAGARAAEILLEGAVGQGANDFKIELARRAIVRALKVARSGSVSNTGGNVDDQAERRNR